MGVVVGVVGARGGAGATMVGAGLAHAFTHTDGARPPGRTHATGTSQAGRGPRTAHGPGPVALVDLAPENGGVDVVLGIEADAGLRWPDLADARGGLDGSALLERLPTWDDVAVVGATRDGPAGVPGDAIVDVCVALADTCAAVVLDLGRGLVVGQLPYGPAVLRLCDEVLVVTPLDLPAVAGALVVRDELARAHCRAALVVRGPAPGTLNAEEIADVVGLEIACEVGWDSRLAGMVERGFGPMAGRGSLARAGRALAVRYTGGPR